MRAKTTLVAAILACHLLPLTSLGQHTHSPSPAETSARVPALEKFHDVIFVVWHDAWPNKDTAKLASLLPEVRKGVREIAAAELPGILREKGAAWQKGVAALDSSAGTYEAAVAAGNAQRLLEAAEQLHARYEALVRVIRPVLKELDDFHATLYTLYHYDLPNYSLEKISAAAKVLLEKMTALNAAVLPARLKVSTDAFNDARTKLNEAVKALNAAAGGGNDADVKAAVEEVHARYEAVQRIFE
ncbi:MAG: hypothetical protein AB1428_02415 [Bacteroidota bacterium]